MEKKKKIIHKKTPKKTCKKCNKAEHWEISKKRLMKILEASGMTPEKPVTMLPRSHDR